MKAQLATKMYKKPHTVSLKWLWNPLPIPKKESSISESTIKILWQNGKMMEPPQNPSRQPCFGNTKYEQCVSVSLEPNQASRDAPMTPSPVLTSRKGTLQRGQITRRRHYQTVKLSVNRDTFIWTRAFHDPSSDESVSTRLVLPNLLAARQTAAWIIGMWGGVRKKKRLWPPAWSN